VLLYGTETATYKGQPRPFGMVYCKSDLVYECILHHGLAEREKNRNVLFVLCKGVDCPTMLHAVYILYYRPE